MPSQPVRFAKGHGTGNDFVLLLDPDADLDLTPGLVRALCDRQAGVGADGVLRVVLTGAVPDVAHLADQARWFMDYRNADGSLAEMCGNGIRVYARYLVDTGYAPPGALRLATRSGVRTVELGAAGNVTVDMGTADVAEGSVLVGLPGHDYCADRVDLGNPHAVVVLSDSLEELDLGTAPALAREEFPDGGNVEFVRQLGPGELALRVFERGVGETRSCGTGACAAVAAVRRRSAGGDRPSAYGVEVLGGRLAVSVSADGRFLLTGPAVLVADGVLRPEWLTAAGSATDEDRPPRPEQSGAGSSTRS